MTIISALERRLQRLEERIPNGSNIIEMVLSTVSDNDLDILQEAAELNACGCNKDEIAMMMGERWTLYQAAVSRFQESVARISSELMKPKVVRHGDKNLMIDPPDIKY